MPPPRIVAEGISKSFRLEVPGAVELKDVLLRRLLQRRPKPRSFWALRDVSLRVHEGESLGVIGVNGAGKSTLLKCLAGILQPEMGTVRLDGRVATLLELGSGFHPALSGRENVFLQASMHGLGRRYVEEILEDVLAFAGLGEFIDQPMRSYSSGMFMRLGFSVAVHIEPEILLIDEIFSVGDEAFQKKCIERMNRFRADRAAIVLVSHDLESVRSFCDRVLLLDGARTVAEGPPDEVVNEYHRRVAERAGAAVGAPVPIDTA